MCGFALPKTAECSVVNQACHGSAQVDVPCSTIIVVSTPRIRKDARLINHHKVSTYLIFWYIACGREQLYHQSSILLS